MQKWLSFDDADSPFAGHGVPSRQRPRLPWQSEVKQLPGWHQMGAAAFGFRTQTLQGWETDHSQWQDSQILL